MSRTTPSRNCQVAETSGSLSFIPLTGFGFTAAGLCLSYWKSGAVDCEPRRYAAPIGLTLYAIFGTSRQLVVAVSSAVAVMSAVIVGGLVPADTAEFIAMTAALAILAGIVAVMAGLLRLGRIAQFFSESVLMGFMSGLALVIMIKQVPKLFGLEPVDGNFWERVIESGGAVLVHCKSGVHRSVAQAASVLIAMGYTADDAMQLIKEKRAVADPDARHIQSRIRKFANQWPPQ